MIKVLFLSGCLILLYPQTAFAYLDPGSGSALFASLIAAVTAGLYSLKVLYYKILGKNASLAKGSYEDTLLIFSEGKSYWGTFRPLVDELIERKIHFRYASLDVHDPGLTVENDYMHSKLYGKNAGGFGKLAAIKAPVMLATTPNIGSDGYPMRRPQKVRELVHVFHALADTSHYKLGSLDFYDSVIMVGAHQEEYLRTVEKARNRPPKEVVALGLPYFDDLYQRVSHQEAPQLTQDCDKRTILVASSWGSKGCLNEYGTDFLKALVDGGFRVIVRLHPHSYIAEPQQVARWKQQTSGLDNFSWDEEMFSTKSMEVADILISDTSSVRFDFSFLHLKPVITLEIPQKSNDEFEACYHEMIWVDKIAPELGAVVAKADIKKLPEMVPELIHKFDRDKCISLRNQIVANFGHSDEAIVPFLQAKVADALKPIEGIS